MEFAAYDVLGYWDPMPNAWGESVIGVDLERVKFWMGRGAMPNKSVQYLLGITFVLGIVLL